MADSGYFQFMQRLKIQDKKKVPLEKERLDDAIWVFVRNLAMGLLFSPLLVYITKLRFVRTVMFRFFGVFFLNFSASWNGFRGNIYNDQVPPLIEFLIIWPMILIEDLWFYIIHRNSLDLIIMCTSYIMKSNWFRTLHTKVLYERIHKFHHKWTQPTALSVFYMHPIEFFLAIVVNIYIGYWVTGCHTGLVVNRLSLQ